MVGRVTSQRCDNCRRRKVKCDLTQPSCLQCVKTGRACPGYETDARFHTWKPKKASPDERVVKALVRASPSTNVVPAFQVVPSNTTDKLRGEFVFKFTQKSVAARFMVIPEHQLFQHIPCRLGQNDALDDAVKCICTTTSNGESKPYVKALHSLQDALNDAERSVTSETLAAATLLQMFEQYVDSADTAWLIHANGVIRMLELRGPYRIQDAVELTTLQVQVGNIFGKAVRDRKPCFLAEPGWKALLKAGRSNANNSSTATKALTNMLEIGVHMPGLLCQYEQLPPGIETRETTAFARRLHDMRQHLQEWLEIYHLDAQLNGTKIDTSNQSTDRIKLASRHSVIIFLIITNYMLLHVQRHELSLIDADHELDPGPASQLMEIIGQNKPLASLAKSTWIQLKRADAIAAANTNKLMRIMLSRVLEVDSERSAEVNAARQVVVDLHSYLAGDIPDLNQVQVT